MFAATYHSKQPFEVLQNPCLSCQSKEQDVHLLNFHGHTLLSPIHARYTHDVKRKSTWSEIMRLLKLQEKKSLHTPSIVPHFPHNSCNSTKNG